MLAASAPGRGIPDLELVGAARESPFGARPVDPADLPDTELVRVASGLLADDVVAGGPPPLPPVGRPRPWRRGRYRLVGDPWLADPARDELVRRGRPPGGRSPIVLVLGTDLATMLTHAWTTRAFTDGAPGWREWVDPLARSGRVPRRVDLPSYAATWAERLGPGRVEVVLDPARLPRLVGVRRALPAPPRLSADAVDLTRLVGAALGLLVLPEQRAALLRHAWGPRLVGLPGPPLGVPARHHDALVRRAVRMRDDLLGAGYPVHGDPDALVPAPPPDDRREPGEPSDTGVLALALRLLLDPAPAPPDPNEPNPNEPRPERGGAMTRRVLLHVGTPKTGTSYLQDVLFRNAKPLAAAGIRYPAHRFDAHFLAALDLMRMPWGGLEAEAIGAWDALAAQVREHDGTSIVSHEILATASRTQVGRALESLGHGDGTEIHVLLSVRDLVRQIPAEWQENVKHRSQITYGSFLEQIQDPDRASRIGSWFWGVQEIPDILDRWGHALPPERIHLVTVPPPGGAPELLWKRFSQAFGLDGLDLDLEVERSNPSLGVPETALIRRINAAAHRQLPPADYRPLVRELLAHQTLSQRTRTPRLGLPPALQPWVAELTDAWVAEVRRRGYDVVGDLDDLVGTPPAQWSDPDKPVEAQVARAGVDAIRALLLENARLRHEEGRLAGELAASRSELERAYLRPTYRFREKVVRRLRAGRAGRGLLKVYRLARGRNSRAT